MTPIERASMIDKISLLRSQAAMLGEDQNGLKRNNNSMSGASVDKHNVMNNPSMHSTLTSTCRSTSGYGNANNEKFIAGNRHYYNPDIVINNICSIVTNIDRTAIKTVIDKYKLHIPSIEETVKVIEYSARLYWRSREKMKPIKELVGRLDDIERAAFVYVGDFFHLKYFNRDFAIEYLLKLSKEVRYEEGMDVSELRTRKFSGDVDVFGWVILNGGDGANKKKIKDTKLELDLFLTCKNIEDTLAEYADMIQAFFTTTNVPAGVGYFPYSMRRVVPTSDTDSTIFTVEDIVADVNDGVLEGRKADAISFAVCYMICQSIVHILALMSANFGINTSKLFVIAMKNEFRFDVFCPTLLTKHYYAGQGIREGVLFAKLVMERKGVHLISSASPPEVIKLSKELIQEILDRVSAGQKIDISKFLDKAANLERTIFESIDNSEPTYLKHAQLKTADSYAKGEEESPYRYHVLWNEVFAPSYGEAPEPAYTVVTVPTTLVNKTAVADYIKEFEDKALGERLMQYIVRNNKKDLKTLWLPADSMESKGIPKDIQSIINKRKLVYGICKPIYNILETLGFYFKTDSMSKLISDYY